MSIKTNIEWATSTGNPWIGCAKVSPGCKNCYAATMDANRFSRTMGGGTKEKPVSHWGKGAPRFRTAGFWKDAVRWNRQEMQNAECRMQNRPRIFPSLCDWLDEEVPIEWLIDFIKLIFDTPNLDWLLLTKRPENFEPRMMAVQKILNGVGNCPREYAYKLQNWAFFQDRPPANVWIGVSVEDQQRADERIPQLLRIPAAIRFVSAEPLLENVNLRFVEGRRSKVEGHAGDKWAAAQHRPTMGIDWVIVGGESGPGRRDCGVEAIVDVARQCQAAAVPCFVKQDCGAKSGTQGRIPEEVWRLKQFPLTRGALGDRALPSQAHH